MSVTPVRAALDACDREPSGTFQWNTPVFVSQYIARFGESLPRRAIVTGGFLRSLPVSKVSSGSRSATAAGVP